MDYRQQYRYWMEHDSFDEATRRELAAIAGDEKEIEDRFYQDLAFGTGGLRGIVGAGTNRMNIYTVRKATQGVADAMNAAESLPGASGAAIAYDCRRMSREFAMETASVFAANGITAYLFRQIMPTPVLSFTVRHLRCAAGVVITASHNPKEYNGYKVYGSEGGQITDGRARTISDYIARVEPISRARTMDFQTAVDRGLIRWIDDSLLDEYVRRVAGLLGDVSPAAKAALRVVYSPLHGTGKVPVTRVLEQAGFEQVALVPAQAVSDSEFSTVKSPNPEEHAALNMAIAQAGEQEADLVIATDPDSDRLGVAYRGRDGAFELLSGNQTGCLLLELRLRQAAEAGMLTADDYAVKTIVTTELARAITARYGVRLLEVLTGFKYIAEAIENNEQAGRGRFLFGFEESYGYLAGSFVRDKDAVIAAMLICEAAARAKQAGGSLGDTLQGIFDRYGCYRENLISHTCRGKDGLEQIRALMSRLRTTPPEKVGGLKVLAVRDYLQSVRTDAEGRREELTLPVSDVLYFELEDCAWMAVRPSGTEPKIKFYTGVRGATNDCALGLTRAMADDITRMVE